tara:strand:- start:812 stop:1123 length:312 start_codon:yes stop_codon:yes gene_type:complete
MELNKSLRLHCIIASVVTTLIVWAPISLALSYLGIFIVEDHHFGMVMVFNAIITQWYVKDKSQFTEYDFISQKRVPISFFRIWKVSAVVQLFAFIIPLISILF